MTHARLGRDDDAVPREVEPAPQVQPVAEGAESGVESADGLVGLGADEEPGGADAEDIARSVVLPLVDVVVADAFEPSGARRGENTQFEESAPVPAHLLDADGANGLADGGRLNEFIETLGFGGRVLVKDPPPVFRGESGSLCARTLDCIAQVAGAANANELRSLGNTFGREGGDVATCDVNDGQRVRGHRLILDGPQDGLSERRLSPRDEDRADGALRGAQPAIRRRRRLSRSDMPPQMPKRSSFASAYSRQSSRTWQA